MRTLGHECCRGAAGCKVTGTRSLTLLQALKVVSVSSAATKVEGNTFPWLPKTLIVAYSCDAIMSPVKVESGYTCSAPSNNLVFQARVAFRSLQGEDQDLEKEEEGEHIAPAPLNWKCWYCT